MTTTNSPEAQPQGGASGDLHSLICGVIHRHCKDVQLPFGINGLEKDLIEALNTRATTGIDPVNTYPTVIESVQLLEAAGYGAEGKPNTLLAMVKEVLAAAPRATGETTVESALAELREMFPAKLRGNKNGRSIFIESTEHGHGRRSGDSDICKKVLIHIEYATGSYSAPLVIKSDSLDEAMAQVRAAAQIKAERDEK